MTLTKKSVSSNLMTSISNFRDYLVKPGDGPYRFIILMPTYLGIYTGLRFSFGEKYKTSDYLASSFGITLAGLYGYYRCQEKYKKCVKS